MNTAINVVTVATFRRPFHTRLCLEAIARAQRWSASDLTPSGWADRIAICVPCNTHEHPEVLVEIAEVMERNTDIPFEVWEEDCPSNPHDAS